MKILIVGRTATGKDTLAKMICDELDKKAVLSATTRPKRGPDDQSHRFVTEEQAARETDKVATTTIGSYLYYATRQDVLDADVYVIDPNGLYELATNMPDTAFLVIRVRTDPETAKQRFIRRAGGTAEAMDLYEARNQAEDKQFRDFETKNDFSEFNNVFMIHEVYNSPTDTPESAFMDTVENVRIIERQMQGFAKVINTLIANNVFREVKDGKVKIVQNDGSTFLLSEEVLPYYCANDYEGIGRLFMSYLALPAKAGNVFCKEE